jgi:hypothetical protein
MRSRIARLCGLLAVVLLLSPTLPAGAQSAEFRRLKSIQSRHEDEIMAIPGVVGIGIGRGAADGLAFKVLVAVRTPAIEAAVPDDIEGVPVDVEEIGEIVAQ